jgi:signal transduction histidine kinase
VTEPGRRYNIAWAALAGALLGLAGWSRGVEAGLLVPAAVLVVAGAVAGWRVRGSHRGAAVLLAGALAAGLVTEARLARLTRDWAGIVAERETRLVAELDLQMRALEARGRRAAAQAAAAVDQGGWADVNGLFDTLISLRRRTGMAALAVLDARGELEAWSGEHRGLLPDEARLAAAPVVFVEGPLFSYLYFAAPVVATGGHAVAAALVETGLPVPAELRRGFADGFAGRHATRPAFGPPSAEPWSWRMAGDGAPVLQAFMAPPSQASVRAEVAGGGRRLAALLTAAALLLLGAGWVARRRHHRWPGAVPLLLAAAVLPLLPLGLLLDLDRLFSPALFLLPGWGDITLGTLLAGLLPVGALAATFRPRPHSARVAHARIAAGALAVAAGYPVVLHVLLGAASPALMENAAFLWGVFHLAALLVLAVPTALLMPRRAPATGRRYRLLVIAGLGASATLALIVAARARGLAPPEFWTASLWALPFVAVAVGTAPYSGRGGRLVRWLLAGWLAATVALPHIWLTQVHGRLLGVERELGTLGMRADPFLDFLLRQFGDELVDRHAAGETGLPLLYRAWVSSGLAREGYPVRVTLWSADGEPELELPLSGVGEVPRVYPASLAEQARTRGTAVAEVAPGLPGASQVLVVPLPDGRVVSVLAPPRRTLEPAPILAPFLGGDPRHAPSLTLIPVQPGRRLPEGVIQWGETAAGWQSEALVRYPEGEYHAHVEVRAPPRVVRMARGILLLTMALLALTGIWLLGRAAGAEPPGPPGGWGGWMRSFRARVTLALFAFFLLPTVVFGWVAYGALAGEVARAARIVSERAVAQAAAAFPDVANDLTVVAAITGEEVLYYQGGELLGASSPEAMELGLYNGWMPPDIYLAFRTGEELGQVETRRLGAASYLVAYRRLPPAGILAVPVSLVAGEATVRQRELADLVLFGILVGAFLSLALSVAVGRELAGPIGRLRRAAEAVGAGRLRVRLPEERADEFGQLYASFNRMVRRLRRARIRERRSARVLAWGEMARQVAHEIKNPLTPIKLSVQHLRRARADRRPDFDEILHNNVEQILTEIDRLTEIAQAFSRFGAPPESAGPLEAVATGRVVAEAVALYRAGDEAVRYSLRVEAGLPPATARTGELKEVILNLLENARAAVSAGGAIDVAVASSKGEILIEVRDDGEGIPAEQLPSIFEPHFSTRSAGTGLGLAIVRRFVESWGGTVGADSEPGAGTMVWVRIPPAPADAPGT